MSVNQKDDQFWDEKSQMWLCRSGVARWRERLAEADASRDPSARAALLAKLRQGPAAVA